MTLIRVRLCIDRGPCFKAEQCWMLVETSSCKFIHDFEYLIRKKFFADDGHNVILNLYLDDFLLPSQEKIAVIRDNDVIRVKEGKVPASKNGNFLNGGNKDKNPKKRKFEESNDVKKKIKKIKHSPTKNKKEQDNMVSAKPSKNPPQSQVASTKTSLKTFNKAKCQKAMDFLQKVTTKPDNTKKLSCDESPAGSSCQGKKIKHKNKSLKKKFNLNCILEKFNPTSDNKQSSTLEQVGASAKGSKEGLHSVSKPLILKKGDKEHNKPVKDVQKTHIDAISGSKEVLDSNKRKGETVKEKKKPSLIQASHKSSTSASSATSDSSSSDGESNANMVKRNAFNCETVCERDEPQEGAKVPQTLGQDVNENELYKQNQRHNVCPPKQSTSNHIRFDYSTEPVERTAETAPLPSCPNVLPACPANMDNNAINGTPNLSPIQQNNIEHTTPTDNVQIKLLKIAAENNLGKGSCRSNNFRKDVYTYKSVVMESTRMEKEPEPEVLCPIPTNVPQKDFSKYQPLVGPPRVGETVAYKILELSQSYTAEISQYKVGKVLSFDQVSNSMNLKLTKESLTRATGDGRISFKFELFERNEEDEEDSAMLLEIPDEVEVKWISMIDPRLIVADNVQ